MTTGTAGGNRGNGAPSRFYDQLGNGNSARPNDPSLWTVALFVEELGHMRHALGLDRVHILGQSWGGMLAMEYALTSSRIGQPDPCRLAGQRTPMDHRDRSFARGAPARCANDSPEARGRSNDR